MEPWRVSELSHNRITVLVLMGGPDAERDVSLMSGKETAQALRDCGRFEVIEQIIDDASVDELREFGAEAASWSVCSSTPP